MTDRIQGLLGRVFNENYTFTLNDMSITALISANSEIKERSFIIREEYSKLIKADEYSLLAGEYTNVWLLEPKIAHDSENEVKLLLEKYKNYKNKLYMVGGYHLVADFDSVLKNGISGLIDQIGEARKNASDESQKSFLSDLDFAVQCIMAWIQAYVDAYRDAAQKSTSPKRRAELMQIADICSRVPYLPATSFREAVQSYYFTYILFKPDGLGRIDQYLYPYYINDVNKKLITQGEALELIEELFVKIFAWRGKNEARSANNHGVVGGYTEDGECGHNACTSLILEALTDLPIWRPQISYRVTVKTTAEQLQEATEAHCKRPDLIMFLNDDAMLKGLLSVGVPYKDAVGYSSSGCNETVLSGCSQPGALEGLINVMYPLERLLNDEDSLDNVHSFNDFYTLFEKNLREDLDIIFNLSYEKDSVTTQPLTRSLLTSGCISSGRSISRGGAKYNFCTWCLTGLVNLADSMSIINQIAFDEERYTVKELAAFLKANWQGYEKQRAYIMNNCHYFGNNDDLADAWINRICESVNKIAKDYTPYRGGRYLFGTLTGYEISHIVFGNESGASLDGRYAKEPFAASISAFPGAEKNGLTSYLSSAAKLDNSLIQSSVVVNLKLDKSLIASTEKRALLTSILRTYFKLGGVQLQINYLSASELIDAQAHPEKHSDLRVRVTGFSGFFTSLEKDLQDEIIKRHLHVL